MANAKKIGGPQRPADSLAFGPKSGPYIQLFSSKVAPQLRQVTVILPFPLGTPSCCPQLGHLK